MATSFEQGFADAERGADNATKSLAKLATAVRHLHKATKLGDIGAMRRSSRQMATLLDAVVDDIAAAERAWPFDETEEVEYLQNNYLQELVETARLNALTLFERDGQLICSPSILRLQASDRSVRVDRQRVASLRPSALVGTLKARQAKPPRFTPERFIETLFEAYSLLTETTASSRPRLGLSTDKPAIPLDRVFRAFRLGAGRDYDRTDFARDLYLLDASRVMTTKKGARLSFPASTGTRGSHVFPFVTPEGETITYYAIRFS